MVVHGVSIEANMPISEFTSLGVGGVAQYYARAGSRQEILTSVAWAYEHGLPLLILGGGSNLLVADSGFPGLVLRIGLRGMRYSMNGAVDITAAAGERWQRVVNLAVERRWAGIECLAGIPGLVGATPIQNVGAYGQDVRETITHVEVLDIRTGVISILANAECAFAYRDSRFKSVDRGRYIILSVTYRLIPQGPPVMRYSELEQTLAERGVRTPSLSDVRAAVLELRRRKSMLLNLRDPNGRSAGSFFINPILSQAEFASLQAAIVPYLHQEDAIPWYATEDGRIKVSAAWLIEHAGFIRGYSRGRVGLSSNHALAVVNHGGSTAAEVIALARDIRNKVRDLFGITLVPEPTLVGLSLDENEQSEKAWA
ncbi:MAG: UDP-N-acetylmuramate dehydrogenase [Armatimonadota bacterium]